MRTWTRAVVPLALVARLASVASAQSQDLQKLVAPIALYPDALVAQILPASTQPVQVVEAARAVAGGQRPDEATAGQWDASVQALLSYPSVLKMMNDKIGWTTRLGEAVVQDQTGVMSAIQAVRRQAQAAGNLQSNQQQVVKSQGDVIVIEPANPAVIYVPQYNPVAILAPPPAYAYAPLMTFGIGFAAGAATAYACDWGYHGGYSVTVNNNYHYSYNNNYNANTYYHGGGSYTRYNPQTGSSGTYHAGSNTYTGYNARTGTYGAYNPNTGKYGTYNPSTNQYDKDGQKGTWSPGQNRNTETTGSGNLGGTGGNGWGGRHSGWGGDGGSGGDAFHGLGGGGFGAQEASGRGAGSSGGRDFGGGFGGFDRGGGFGGGGFGGGGFRGGGFRGRR
ncbi:MAG: DUF3300 domain-containing protein [bacterium]|nr:DUF3300 domain-containing protein [bacterium]